MLSRFKAIVMFCLLFFLMVLLSSNAIAAEKSQKQSFSSGCADITASGTGTSENNNLCRNNRYIGSTEGNIVNFAKKFIGVRYVYGGKSPRGFDCSGFIGYVYKNFGINLSRSAQSMYTNGIKVSRSALKAGDILFFDASPRKSSGAVDHAGIYLGNDNFIHASSSTGVVRIQKLSQYKGIFLGAKRVT
jgi:cell wall-associated NlpC family hydrolase